jgi:general L-amino acid transport system substrate-binding protein
MTQTTAPQEFSAGTLPAALSRSASLSRIIANGVLTVGTSAGIKGMSFYENGTCKGMDADFGRALSAVIFADQRDVSFHVVNPIERFSALADATIDIGLYNASKTMSRELDNDVVVPVVTIIDGEGILTKSKNEGKTLASWDVPTIGVQGGTTSPANIARSRKGSPCDIRPFETLDEAIAALKDDQVDAVVFDTIGLAGVLSDMPEREAYTILPERISRELMGPVVPVHDPLFARIVEWTFAALVHASDLNITTDSVAKDASELTNQQTEFLDAGLPLWSGDPQAKQRMVHLLIATGNSAEIFDRNLGQGSELRIAAGLNASTANGGILHPAPL